MDGTLVVHSGEPWPFETPPCSRSAVKDIEGRENYVYWLQPVSGGVDDQFPAILFRDQFYNISLRVMKAVWRHVRLRKGFVNLERAPYGGLKLRIPLPLYNEKMRTQSRFHVGQSFYVFHFPCIKDFARSRAYAP